MKKILSIALAAAIALAGTNAFAQVSVGAGWLNSTNTTKVNGDKQHANLNGFYVGAFFNEEFSPYFSFNPGIYFSYLGANNSKSYYGLAKTKADTKETYLSIPLNFRYNYELAPDMRLFAYAGPTLSVGLSGKVSSSASALGIKASGDVKYYDSDELDYKRFDCLLGGGVGYEFNDMIQVTVGYKYGVVNTSNTDGLKRHKGMINLGVAYIF